MEKLKQYKKIILVVIIIFGFIFYWFEWRPSQIKKYCYKEADKWSNGVGRASFEYHYSKCLKYKGF